MTIEEQNAFLAVEYAEAMRYMDNAEETLRGAKREGRHFADDKYVRTACGTAYNGVLIALDAWLAAKGVQAPVKPRKKSKGASESKPKRRKSIEYYEKNVAKLDKKLLSNLITAYEILHLDGYYSGETIIKIIEGGFDSAYEIIEKIKPFTED